LQESYSDGVAFSADSVFATLTVSPAATNVTPGNASAVFSNGTQTTSVIVAVASPSGVVDSGTVKVLLNGNTIGSGSVNDGSATVTLNLPPGLAAGSYSLTENYTGTTNLLSSSAIGTLTVSAASTTITPGNVTVSFNGSPQTANVTVGISSPSGPVNSGTVTVLLNGSSLGTGTVSNGSSTITLTIPAGQALGSYSLTETYSGDANLSSSTANGTLTVNAVPSPSPSPSPTPSPSPSPSPSPLQAALTIAIDTAALLLQSDAPALAQLAQLAQVFLHQPLPMGTGALIASIQANIQYADGLAISALEGGIAFANSV